MTTHTTPRLFQPRYTVVHAIFLDSSQSRSPAADRRTQNRGGPRVADQVRTRQSLAGRSNESMSNLDDDLPPPMYNPLSTDATVHPSSDGHDLPTDSCILDIPPPTYSPSRIATTPASHGITETRSGALLSPLPVLDPSLSPSGPLSPLPPTYPQAIAPPQPAQLTENPSVMIAIGSA
ncbi:hypothetical protein BC939DRAFT_461147 [Gamsiella multidivaricata]|uniref:uncharacterized protein n=1 Tax=Gamsiella multidivaricata TaxID=101098 RepID=UPI002220C52E|nr:uncharacterized protein BC939DRAFT_461147 [Gamsiella multidivaricata]KAI7819100.1 hypothetical protein BC939DRAFT_461147 [Gamsiella multidivaricata]